MSKRKAVKSSSQPLIGKVSVKHFLNTRLKGRPDPFGNEKRFPVYMRVVFNRKTSSIKSDFRYFTEQSISQGQDVFSHIKYKLLYSPGDTYLTAKEFNKPYYLNSFNEEARVVSEIVLFYGKYGTNILRTEAGRLITSSLSPIKHVVSDHFSRKLYDAFKGSIIQDIINLASPFDKQFKALDAFGSKEMLRILETLTHEYNAFQMLEKATMGKTIRVYEWIFNDFKDKFKLVTDNSPDLLIKLQQAISKHYDDMLSTDFPALWKLISKDI